jgi:hypothetical protein
VIAAKVLRVCTWRIVRFAGRFLTIASWVTVPQNPIRALLAPNMQVVCMIFDQIDAHIGLVWTGDSESIPRWSSLSMHLSADRNAADFITDLCHINPWDTIIIKGIETNGLRVEGVRLDLKEAYDEDQELVGETAYVDQRIPLALQFNYKTL